MNRARAVATLIVVASLVGCGDSSSGSGSGSGSSRLTDPTGDTYGAGTVQWDLTALTVSRDAGGITVLLDFADSVISPTSGNVDAMIGYVDFDADQDSTTGLGSIVDAFRPAPGSTGLGVDYSLRLDTYGADSSVAVIDSLGNTTGLVKPVFSNKRVTIPIPAAMLGGDDGHVNVAAIVGTGTEPTDIIPENSHLSLLTETVLASRPGPSAAIRKSFLSASGWAPWKAVRPGS